MIQVNWQKQIPVLHHYDVVVVGGGPAGIAAAVSAVRTGVSVALIERYGCLGGNLTVGHISPILGAVAPGTYYDEIVALLAHGHEEIPVTTRNGREIHLDRDEAKGRLTEWVVSSGVDLYLQAPVADVSMEGDTLTGILVCSQDGLVSITGGAFVDATGDGYLSHIAGVPHQMGRDNDGLCQPVSLEFLVEGVDEKRGICCYGGSDPVVLPDGTPYSRFCQEVHDRGELPENVTIVRLHKTFYPGERNVNATQINGINPLTFEGVTQAERELRRQVVQVWEFLRKYIPGYEHSKIKSSADTLGVRESRRMEGEYTLSDDDVAKGSRFEDVVVHRAWFLIDIHNPTGGGQAEGQSQPAKEYDIPYRCLVPQRVDGLLLSGRCISGTHRAHASYRVMAICMATGEAAGLAAALSVKGGITPRNLDPHIVQEHLQKRGVVLFDS